VAIRPDAVRVFAPAKINLFLHVTRKRPDGYHDLQSLVAFGGASDLIFVEPNDTFLLTIDGPFGAGLAAEPDNLILRAARALADRLPEKGAHFRLTKNLPVASGIGGGSADAAAALRGLLALNGKDFRDEPGLEELAATLGSDVPVCLASGAAWMEGRGEILTALPPFPPTHIVLVNPGVSVSTAEVFRRLVIREGEVALSPPPEFASASELAAYLQTTRNDLEAPALDVAPVINSVLDALRREGALFARMSGSGATCFGIFESGRKAEDAWKSIEHAEPKWWVRPGEFRGTSAPFPDTFFKRR